MFYKISLTMVFIALTSLVNAQMHASFFKIKQKLARLALKPKLSPFIDSQSYIDFVERNEKAFHKKLTKQIKAANR